MRTQKESQMNKMSEEMLKLLISLDEGIREMKGEIGEIKATGISTLTQATKTNGRVTCLEEVNAELSKIVSRHNGVLLKWEQNAEEKKKISLERQKLIIGLTPKIIWLIVAICLLFIFDDFQILLAL